jgi:hypothetical protein
MGLVAAWLCGNCDVWLGGGTTQRTFFLERLSFRGCMVFAIIGVDVVPVSAWVHSCSTYFLRDAWHRQFHSSKNLD